MAGGKHLMLKGRMENLELPLIGGGAWVFSFTAAGAALGAQYWAFGLVVGAIVGGYAAFGQSKLAALLRWPAIAAAVLAAFGLFFVNGGR